jgi:hypothetical protein
MDDHPGVDHLVELIPGCFDYGGMAMTEVGHRGAAGEVGPPVSVGVRYPDPVGRFGVDFGVEGNYWCEDVVVT